MKNNFKAIGLITLVVLNHLIDKFGGIWWWVAAFGFWMVFWAYHDRFWKYRP